MRTLQDFLKSAIDTAENSIKSFKLEVVEFVDIDLSGVDTIDSEGLNQLLLASAWTQQFQIRIRLLNLQPQPQELLRTTRLNMVFPVIDESSLLPKSTISPFDTLAFGGAALLVVGTFTVIICSISGAARAALGLPWNDSIDKPIVWIAVVTFIGLTVATWMVSRAED